MEGTVILEYGVNRHSCSGIREWARQWQDLGDLTLGSKQYRSALQALTDEVTLRDANPGQLPNRSAINQVTDQRGRIPSRRLATARIEAMRGQQALLRAAREHDRRADPGSQLHFHGDAAQLHRRARRRAAGGLALRAARVSGRVALPGRLQPPGQQLGRPRAVQRRRGCGLRLRDLQRLSRASATTSSTSSTAAPAKRRRSRIFSPTTCCIDRCIWTPLQT